MPAVFTVSVIRWRRVTVTPRGGWLMADTSATGAVGRFADQQQRRGAVCAVCRQGRHQRTRIQVSIDGSCIHEHAVLAQLE